MIVQQNYTPFLVLALVVLGGAVVLGGMTNEKLNLAPTIVSAQTLNAQLVGNVYATPSNFPTRPPATPTPQITPPALETLQAARAQEAVLSAQGAALRATVDAAQAQAALAAIAARQTETAAQQTRVVEQAIAQKTRDAQEAAATADQRAAETALADAKQKNENTRALIVNVLLSVGGINIVACLWYIMAVSGRTKEKEAEAKAYVEQRRLLQVQAAVQSKQQGSAPPTAAGALVHQVPKNGHEAQEDVL